MSKLSIDYDVVAAQVAKLKTTISSDNEDIISSYTKLESLFSESEGDEAEALRDLAKAEKTLVGEITNLLDQFTDSIKFASDEFRKYDIHHANKLKFVK